MAPVAGQLALAVIEPKRISWRQLGSPRLTSIATPRVAYRGDDNVGLRPDPLIPSAFNRSSGATASLGTGGSGGDLMGVKTLISILSCACAALLAGSATASAATTELLTNGSFESGDFSGWTTSQPTQPLRPWSNATAVDRGFLDSASPQDGTHDALHGSTGHLVRTP
jgi:hypothetical protein